MQDCPLAVSDQFSSGTSIIITGQQVDILNI